MKTSDILYIAGVAFGVALSAAMAPASALAGPPVAPKVQPAVQPKLQPPPAPKLPAAVEVKVPPPVKVIEAPKVPVAPAIPAPNIIEPPKVSAPPAPPPVQVKLPAAPVLEPPKVPVVTAPPALQNLPKSVTTQAPTAPAAPVKGGAVSGITVQQPNSAFPKTPGAPGNNAVPGGGSAPVDPGKAAGISNLLPKAVPGKDSAIPGAGDNPKLGTADRLKDIGAGNSQNPANALRDSLDTAISDSAGRAGGVADSAARSDQQEESMVGDGSSGEDRYKHRCDNCAGSTIAPVKYDDDGVHVGDGGKTADSYKDTTLGRIGTAIGSGLPSTPTGQALKQATDEIDGKNTGSGSGSSGSSGSGSASGSGSGSSGTGSTGNDKTYTSSTSSDGTVTVYHYDDGTTIVVDNNNNTSTTKRKDGSTTTTDLKTGKKTETGPTTGLPDEEHQGAPLPEDLQKAVAAEGMKLRALKPDTGSGDIDFGEGGDTAGAAGGTGVGSLVRDKEVLIGNPGSADDTGKGSANSDPNLPGKSDPRETDPNPNEGN